MKTLTRILLLCCSFMYTVGCFAQTADERIDNVRMQLDYRFRGGSGEFERYFCQSVSYDDEATRACVSGVLILSFSVDCNGKIFDYGFRNPMGSTIDAMVRTFYQTIQNQWNPCSDGQTSVFEVPVLFRMSDMQTSGKGLFTIECESPGYKCKDDSDYLEEFERLKTTKPKKAERALEELLKRDPYNVDYHQLKKDFTDHD